MLNRSTLMFLVRLVLSLFAVLLLLTSSRAAIVAEHALPENATGWFNLGAGIATDGAIYDNRLAQVFTPLGSGILDDVSISVYRMASTNADLRISVATMQGGQPGTILGSALLPHSQVGTASLSDADIRDYTHTLEFTANISLQSGTLYALIFSTDSTEANYRIYGDNSGYAAGYLLDFQNSGPWESRSGDLVFQVRTIPEPHVAAMTGFVVMLAGLVRRRNIPRWWSEGI